MAASWRCGRWAGASACEVTGSGFVRGRTYELAVDLLDRALEHLDDSDVNRLQDLHREFSA